MKILFCYNCSFLGAFHKLRSLVLPVLLLLPLLFLPSLARVSAAGANGNEQLLKRCWSADQLKGSFKEKSARRSRHYARPPTFKSAFAAPTTSPLTTQFQKKGTVRWVKLPQGKKLIALTLDLCEAAYEISGYDGGVIDYLRAHKIKATLFVGGKWMDHHSERAQQLIADPLFEIGSHGWSHKNLRKVHGKALVREVSAVQDAYERAFTALKSRKCYAPSLMSNLLSPSSLSLTKEPLNASLQHLSLFRFPFGTCHKQAIDEVYKQGQLPIQWNVVTGDPAFGQSAKRIASIVKQRVKPGAIIIAHANGRGRNTARALPLFIPDLLKQGYEFVTVSELIAAGEPQISSTCYENRPGDNSHY